MSRKQIDFNDNKVGADLQNDVKADTYNSIKGYSEALEEVNMYCENNNIPLSQGFGTYVMDEAKSKNLQEKFMSPLIKESANLNNRRKSGVNGGLSNEDMLIAEKMDLINDDMNIIQDKYDTTWELYADSIVSTGDLAPMMAAKPPLQYLETIRNNGRLVIDHKSAEDYTVRRKYERKYVDVNGERGYFPDVVKDSNFMDQFLNHSQPEFEAEVVVGDHTDNLANLINLSGVDGVNADNDVLYPEMKLTEITIEVEEDLTDDSTANPTTQTYTTALLENNDTIITAHKTSTHTPQFFIKTQVEGGVETDNTEPTVHEVTLAGSIDFDSGELSFQVSPEVVSFKAQARISGSRINKVSTVGVETTPMEFTIKERINMALSYDPKSLKDFATIENTDGLMKMTSVILDLSEHIKDHKVFKALEEDKELLAETNETLQRLETGEGTRNDYFDKTFYANPIAGDNYRPTSHIGWREEVLPDLVDDVSISMMKRFNSKSGIKSVIYGDPSITKLMPNMTKVISKDKEYAGVSVDYDVFSMEIKGSSFRVVSTERAKNNTTLRMIPRSNSKEQETWTFYQHFSHLYKDSSIRDVNAVHLPSIAYIDTFDVFGIHRIMGNISVNTDQKTIEDMAGESYLDYTNN